MNRGKLARLTAAWAVCLALAATAAAWNEERVLLRDLPTQAKLARHVDCDFQGATLAEVLQFFRQKLNLCVVLDPSASDLAQKPISMTMEDVPARTALTVALRQVRLQYAVAMGIVWVGDREFTESKEPLQYRQYDVADLVTDVSQGGMVTATGAGDDSSINKPRADRAGGAGEEPMCALKTTMEMRNRDITLGASGVENSGIRKESKRDGF